MTSEFDKKRNIYIYSYTYIDYGKNFDGFKCGVRRAEKIEN